MKISWKTIQKIFSLMHVRHSLSSFFFGAVFLLLFVHLGVYAIPPSFHEDVARDVRNSEEVADAQGRVERLFGRNVSEGLTIQENIRNLLYPQGGGGQIRNILRIIGYGLVVGGLVYIGLTYIKDSDDESKAKEATLNILYLFGGSALFFGSIWILGTGLVITNIQGSASVVSAVENSLFLQFLLFLKGMAFFAAIVMTIWYGFQILSTVQKEDKRQKGKDGILNVMVALAFIKGIDYVYLIAQSPNFKDQATELIVQAAQILAYLLGFAFVIFMIYAGIRLVTDGGKGEGFNEFKKIAVGIFLGGIVIFLFLLIMYQVIQEFV